MCVERDTFGVEETIRAADAVSCKCGDEGCILPTPSIESVVRWQAEPTHEPTHADE
jgi:hypothetical protein